MSYIIPSTSPFVSIKLTEKGRQQLSLGQLNFTYWAIGDSEINYGREAVVDANQNDVVLSASSRVMRPFDRQPNIKYFINPSNSTSQYQPIISSSSSLNVVKAIVNNEAAERGFFGHTGTTFATSLDSILTPYYKVIPNASISGGTNLVFASLTGVTVRDYMLLKLSNDISGTVSSANTTTAIPNLWFQVQTVSGNSITVDRNLPNYSADSAYSSVIFYRGGEVYNTIATGNTTAYWDTGTLSFNSSVNITCHDVPVWNMNNVWCENLAGMSATTLYEDYTRFGSYQYLGSKNPYFEYLCEASGATASNLNCDGIGLSYPDEIKKAISIIHYTNNAISNLYGEFFFVDATNNKYVQLHMPNIMYHRRGYATGSGTTMGMTFIASGVTKYLGTSDIEYIDLIENPSLVSTASTEYLVVGKVFPQLKMIVVDDEELVAAMSYKSNRNWTLPELAASLSAPSGGTSTGLLQPNETIYLTYILEGGNTGDTITNNLPCQKYVKVSNTTTTAKDIAFRINQTDVLPYMRKQEAVGYDGLGFVATRFKLLYQVITGSTERPDAGAWKVYDFTSNAITVNANNTISPQLLEIQTPTTNGFILDILKNTSASTFNLYSLLNMAPTNQPTYLQFGDERFFYGNLETYIGATIFKTIFDININSGLFNTTTNPTRSTDPATNPPNIRVTEVGIYDNAQNLVCIGKLSNPVELMAGNTVMLELSLDF
jgi:hypothetical protein